ncbi:hypothetical protein WA1_18745 [Scytonema hofmannii PCC 7110]|uniref:Uncharacterized protein n=1 Tax=Scytonema hofmannii PCC 7110 TaxID=128403 RepID=A0A139XBH5_9CYAN|nr:hypothetical protein [Scytonema hofmannii]KYC42041.1 hypothetical protein WA1_18745 [Scytonema hofmannii PCC 7110]
MTRKDSQTEIQKRVELVAQIETLKKAIGWNINDEMNYVKKCFSKASRAFLNLEELQQYLNYLESQFDGEMERQSQNQLNLFEL